MQKYIRYVFGIVSVFLLSISLTVKDAMAQEPIGGPYTADSATVLLLHFDGNTQNASDMTADPVEHGNLSYISDSRMPAGLGQQLHMDNSSPSDSSFMFIPDTTALDLTGSWTMEFWVNVFTYGDTSDDWRWQPRIMFKPGNEQFYYSNYFMTMWGGAQTFKTGYYTEAGDGWQEIESPPNTMKVTKWFHITFIRDTTKQVIVQMIHDVDGNLIHFDSQSYDPITGAPPLVNDSPLYIGTVPGQANFWLDGFLDEMRISNVVRNFAVPPVITKVSQLSNQLADQNYTINSDITTIGDASISKATLHYQVDDGQWASTSMMQTGDTGYEASIPGQSVGSQVRYYVSAETNTGLTAMNPANAVQDTTFYNFAVWKDSTEVLSLDFEGSQGALPTDHSIYNNTVEVFGNAKYSSGFNGNGSAFEFDGDSTYIESNSPYLTSSSFTVDMKFMAQDSLPTNGQRLIAKEGNPWYQVNYQLWFQGGGTVVPASFVPGQGFIGGPLTFQDTTIVPDKWYRVVYSLDQDSAFAHLYSSDGTIISSKGTVITGDAGANITNGPLHIGSADVPNSGLYFRGKVDDIHIYNYVPDSLRVPTAIQPDNPNQLPAKLTLKQNYPNPFNPTTNIKYGLSRAEKVTLKVYDVLGREVATLVNGRQQVGMHTVNFDASNLSSGMYIYRLSSGKTTRVRKMLLIK